MSNDCIDIIAGRENGNRDVAMCDRLSVDVTPKTRSATPTVRQRSKFGFSHFIGNEQNIFYIIILFFGTYVFQMTH